MKYYSIAALFVCLGVLFSCSRDRETESTLTSISAEKNALNFLIVVTGQPDSTDIPGVHKDPGNMIEAFSAVRTQSRADLTISTTRVLEVLILPKVVLSHQESTSFFKTQTPLHLSRPSTTLLQAIKWVRYRTNINPTLLPYPYLKQPNKEYWMPSAWFRGSLLPTM